MRARLLVVLKIASQNPPQRPLVPHDDVIQALPPNRSDQSFHIWILPRRSRSRHHFFEPHALGEGNHCSSENRIFIRICCPVCDGPSGPRNGMKKGSSVTWWICGGCEVVRTVEMLRLLPCLIRSVPRLRE